MDTFKPKTVFLEDSPLEEGTETGINKVIHKLGGNEMQEFIQESIIKNKESYEVDTKHHMIYQAYYPGQASRLPSDNPTYAYYHLNLVSKNFL